MVKVVLMAATVAEMAGVGMATVDLVVGSHFAGGRKLLCFGKLQQSNLGRARSYGSYCGGGYVFAKSQSQGGPASAVSVAVEEGSSYSQETAK